MSEHEGEVEGGDYRPDPVGLADVIVVFPGASGTHPCGVPLFLVHHSDVVHDRVDGLPAFGQGLEPVLSDFVGYGDGDVELPLVDELRIFFEDPHPF